MEKRYVIIARCDAYNARKHNGGREAAITRDGATVVEWLQDSNCGYGYSLNEARAVLHGYAKEDSLRSGEPCGHRYFSLSYGYDAVTYEALPVNCVRVDGAREVIADGWFWKYGEGGYVKVYDDLAEVYLREDIDEYITSILRDAAQVVEGDIAACDYLTGGNVREFFRDIHPESEDAASIFRDYARKWYNRPLSCWR